MTPNVDEGRLTATTASFSTGGPSKRWTTSLLILILLAGFLLRAWYASYNPTPSRFEDEKYAVANVRSILTHHTLEPDITYYPSPVFNLPPAALLAASDAVSRGLGVQALQTVAAGSFTRSGYLLMRLLQALYGTAAVYLMFLLGRRLFGASVGLLGATLLAFVPWHVHASGYIKPDALLSLLTLAVLLVSMRLLSKPGWRSATLLGVVTALAMGAKLTGAVAGVPVGLVSLAPGPLRKRRLLAMVGAVMTTLATFILTNPWWRSYPAWLANLKRDYSMRAGWHGMTHLGIPRRALEFVAGRYALHLWGAVLALVGFALLVIWMLRRRNRVRWEEWTVLTIFPIVWVTAYAIETAYFKPNNMLPILAPCGMAMCVLVVTGWRRVREKVPAKARSLVGWSAATGFVLLLAWPGWAFVYRSLTPSTLDGARKALGPIDRRPAGRVVFIEEGAEQLPRWEGSFDPGRGRVAVVSVADPRSLERQQIEFADAVVLRAKSLRASTRLSGLLQEFKVTRVVPQWPRLRGPALDVFTQRWWHAGDSLTPPLETCGGNCREATLPPAEGVALMASVAIWEPPRRVEPAQVPVVRLDGSPLTIERAYSNERGELFVSRRFHLTDSSRRLVIAGLGSPQRVQLELHRWSRSRPASAQPPPQGSTM